MMMKAVKLWWAGAEKELGWNRAMKGGSRHGRSREEVGTGQEQGRTMVGAGRQE